MASDRGFTGNPPVNILPIRQVNTGASESFPKDSTVSKLVKDVDRRLDSNAAPFLAVFRNRCETIPLDVEGTLTG
jgi:hypothetical protein